MSHQKKILSLSNVSFFIKNKAILKDISLDIFENSIFSIIGPNGSGKTTLIKIILNLLKVHSGKKIFYKQNPIFGYCAQSFCVANVLPLTVRDFLYFSTNKNFNLDNLKDILDIDYLLDASIHNLSGGEMQKVLIMRSLLVNPDILVLDEPTNYLDFKSESYFYDLLLKIKNYFGCAIMIISHNLHLVRKHSNYVLCLDNGHAYQATTQEMIENENSYLANYFQYFQKSH